MKRRSFIKGLMATVAAAQLALIPISLDPPAPQTFNVEHFVRPGDADYQPAFRRAVDAAGDAGGGTVYVPPGEYRGPVKWPKIEVLT